jgi:hypothetical protein
MLSTGMANVGVAGSLMIGSRPRVPIVRNPWKSSEMTVDEDKFSSSLLASVPEKDFSHSCLGFFEDLDPYGVPKLDFV